MHDLWAPMGGREVPSGAKLSSGGYRVPAAPACRPPVGRRGNPQKTISLRKPKLSETIRERAKDEQKRSSERGESSERVSNPRNAVPASAWIGWGSLQRLWKDVIGFGAPRRRWGWSFTLL